MNIHFGNQSQFELFPGTTGEPIENTAPRFIFSRIVLTFENVVVVFVFMIVSLIIAFSIGVERGRVRARMAHSVAQLAVPVAVQTESLPSPQVMAVTMPQNMTGAAQAAQSDLSPVSVVAPIIDQPAAAQKDVDKGYTVQVASYKKESMAEKEAMNLKREGFESFTMQKGDYVIICVGKFTNQDKAKQMLSKLKKRYKDSMIRSL